MCTPGQDLLYIDRYTRTQPPHPPSAATRGRQGSLQPHLVAGHQGGFDPHPGFRRMSALEARCRFWAPPNDYLVSTAIPPRPRRANLANISVPHMEEFKVG